MSFPFPLRSGLMEVSGAASSGKTGLALSMITAAQQAGDLAAFVDPQRMLFAPAAAAAGVDLGRLLVVHPPDVADGFRVVDHLLRSRGFHLIVLDTTDTSHTTHKRTRHQRPAPDRLFRISRLAKVADSTVVLMTETSPGQPSPPSFGSPVSLRLGVTRTGFRFVPRPKLPFVLGGARIDVAVKKSKYGVPGNKVTIEQVMPET